MLEFGYDIPAALRSSYILAIYGRAETNINLRFTRADSLSLGRRDAQEPQSWSQLADGGVEIHVIPGDHQSILKEPYLKYWAEDLKTRLSKAWSVGLNQILLNAFEADAYQGLLLII